MSAGGANPAVHPRHCALAVQLQRSLHPVKAWSREVVMWLQEFLNGNSALQ